MSDKKYWQHLGELADEEKFRELGQDEFNETLPFEDASGKGWLDAKSPRRDFLKYLGFSTAAASLAASCEIPVRKAIPYANKPDNVQPGIAKYYATTFVQDGDVIPIVAKVRDGRPIKIEGNTLSTITGGGTSAQAQASVLDLYDTHRLRHPKRRVNNKLEEVPNLEQLDKMVMDALAGVGAGQVVLLTSTIVSPSTKDIISKYANLRHVQYDGVSYSGMLLANETTGGGRRIPSYHFENAEVIVSLGADFLGTWLSPVEFGKQYAVGRKIDENNPRMSKHYQFESFLSATGANADERFTHKPSQTGAVAVALLAAVGGGVPAPALNDAKLMQGINKVANDLKAHTGRALVVCGSNDVNVQIIVNAINSAIGAYGSTIDTGTPVNYRQGIDKDLADLITQMEAGQVGALLIYGANPAYDYFDATRFVNALRKVRVTVSFNEKLDETTELCQYVIPHPHYLESWGDAEPKPGHYCFIQPTIFPLFKTRHFQTSLLKWSGNNTDYETYFRQYWEGRLGKKGLENALRDGVIEPGGQRQVVSTPVRDTTATVATTGTATGFGGGGFNGGGVAAAVAVIASIRSGTDEVILYQKVSIGTGKQAGNPWLQELPDPVTKATWDNYAMISLVKAKEWFGLDFTDRHNSKKAVNYQYFPDKPVISIKVNNKELRLPVLVIPGMNANTIAIAVGYGRSVNIGKVVAGVGQNAYPLASFNGTTVNNYNTNVTVEKTGDSYKLALMQLQNSYENRTEVVKETTLATFKKYPNAYKNERDKLSKDYAKKTGNYRAEATLYPDPDSPDRTTTVKWGMTIDMNSCIGCQACVVACHAENNVPVVGKKQVMRFHDMHWLRIDRYFVTSENPDDLKTVVFQPMLCQHCDNAPCENVCPVAATPHSDEGINMMAYNRCVGTRYCANNCPYKVRRFNWADYTGADSFRDNQSHLGDVVAHMNEDLTRMVLNPDVTVRSRGVMEKCSFCIQRTQEAKLNAKKENRILKDGDVKTACMQACPTGAIVFGNVKDPQSEVSMVRAAKPKTSFHVIDQLHTLPNITYLAKIRNTDEIIEMEYGAEHAQDQEEGTHKPEIETH